MSMWNPWRGCRKCSDGCLHCYIHKGDARRGVDTSRIVRTADFDKPIRRKRDGTFQMQSGLVYLGFSTDFLIAEADPWREACWEMIRQRPDCTFLFLTKRIGRLRDCLPPDWGQGYENVVVCCTVENQKNADEKLPIFRELPLRHRCITAQPLLGPIQLEAYLDEVELVVVGGESDKLGRPMDYAWVLDIREQCIRRQVNFEFRQCSTHFCRDGKTYTIPTRELARQAKLAAINWHKEP